jgi:hypothetical protein
MPVFRNLIALLGPLVPATLNSFPTLLVIRDKELFDLGEPRLADVVNRRDVFVIVRMGRYGEQPFIRLSLSIVHLFSRNNAYQSYFDQTPYARRRIHEYENVERISVVS